HRLPSSPLLSHTNPATTELYTLSLHDALPILPRDVRSTRKLAGRDHRFCSGLAPAQRRLARRIRRAARDPRVSRFARRGEPQGLDRKSTRLNSSHVSISYAVFCLKKKKITSCA